MKNALLNLLIILAGVAIGDYFFNESQISAFVIHETRHLLTIARQQL
jgi:hypothetical protein